MIASLNKAKRHKLHKRVKITVCNTLKTAQTAAALVFKFLTLMKYHCFIILLKNTAV